MQWLLIFGSATFIPSCGYPSIWLLVRWIYHPADIPNEVGYNIPLHHQAGVCLASRLFYFYMVLAMKCSSAIWTWLPHSPMYVWSDWHGECWHCGKPVPHDVFKYMTTGYRSIGSMDPFMSAAFIAFVLSLASSAASFLCICKVNSRIRIVQRLLVLSHPIVVHGSSSQQFLWCIPRCICLLSIHDMNVDSIETKIISSSALSSKQATRVRIPFGDIVYYVVRMSQTCYGSVGAISCMQLVKRYVGQIKMQIHSSDVSLLIFSQQYSLLLANAKHNASYQLFFRW